MADASVTPASSPSPSASAKDGETPRRPRKPRRPFRAKVGDTGRLEVREKGAVLVESDAPKVRHLVMRKGATLRSRWRMENVHSVESDCPWSEVAGIFPAGEDYPCLSYVRTAVENEGDVDRLMESFGEGGGHIDVVDVSVSGVYVVSHDLVEKIFSLGVLCTHLVLRMSVAGGVRACTVRLPPGLRSRLPSRGTRYSFHVSCEGGDTSMSVDLSRCGVHFEAVSMSCRGFCGIRGSCTALTIRCKLFSDTGFISADAADIDISCCATVASLTRILSVMSPPRGRVVAELRLVPLEVQQCSPSLDNGGVDARSELSYSVDVDDAFVENTVAHMAKSAVFAGGKISVIPSGAGESGDRIVSLVYHPPHRAARVRDPYDDDDDGDDDDGEGEG